MQENSIIAYTEQIAGEIANRYVAAPLAELQLWLRLAHQREAMVSQLYELSEFDTHLAEATDPEIRQLIHSVVHGIWAHEASHTTYLSTVREGAGTRAALAQLQGEVEGWVTQRATRGDTLARLLIAVGAALGKVPGFARELQRMSLLELLQFNAELEATARMGYERILQIAAQVEPARLNDFGYSLPYDIASILAQETFHHGVFVEMQGWLRGAGSGLNQQHCTQALHRLCGQTLGTGVVRALATEMRPGFEASFPPSGAEWVSDGGLGGVFRAAGLSVPIARVGS